VLDQIKRLFEYDNWALMQEFSALKCADNQPALGMLAHILAAKEIWLVRLNGKDSSSIDTRPGISLNECRSLASELYDGYNNFLSLLIEADLETAITYKNTKGDGFTTPIGEILTHVAFHSAYHRGQIALLLRQANDAAINTDFITFTRL
jgi:uncharacterized damage-inducible protein DinB